jgi:hypothetical protein
MVAERIGWAKPQRLLWVLLCEVTAFDDGETGADNAGEARAGVASAPPQSME